MFLPVHRKGHLRQGVSQLIQYIGRKQTLHSLQLTAKPEMQSITAITKLALQSDPKQRDKIMGHMEVTPFFRTRSGSFVEASAPNRQYLHTRDILFWKSILRDLEAQDNDALRHKSSRAVYPEASFSLCLTMQNEGVLGSWTGTLGYLASMVELGYTYFDHNIPFSPIPLELVVVKCGADLVHNGAMVRAQLDLSVEAEMSSFKDPLDTDAIDESTIQALHDSAKRIARSSPGVQSVIIDT